MQLLVLLSAEWWWVTEVTVFRSHSITMKHQKKRTVERSRCEANTRAELPICKRGGQHCSYRVSVVQVIWLIGIHFLCLQVRFLVDLQRCTEELTSHRRMSSSIIRYITSLRADSHVTHTSGLQVDRKKQKEKCFQVHPKCFKGQVGSASNAVSVAMIQVDLVFV